MSEWGGGWVLWGKWRSARIAGGARVLSKACALIRCMCGRDLGYEDVPAVSVCAHSCFLLHQLPPTLLQALTPGHTVT